jgi:TolB-like protein
MGKHAKLSWSGLTAELGRREVYPVVVAYAVVAWLLLQIGEVTFTPLGLPDWVMTGLIIGVVAGFPVAIALAWRYDITASGIFRDRADVHALVDKEFGPSVAVLPFIDLSPEQDQAYFCEGVAEEITNALVRIPSLRVAARSSAFQYNSEAGDVREIGSELGVNTILEGSVRKSHGVIRITAQLVKVSDGCHLWSRSFDRELQDVFAIQEEIAASIAASLLDTISGRDRSSAKPISSAPGTGSGRPSSSTRTSLSPGPDTPTVTRYSRCMPSGTRRSLRNQTGRAGARCSWTPALPKHTPPAVWPCSSAATSMAQNRNFATRST